MAARMFAPKVASLMGSTSAKVARPVIRSSVKANGSQRAFSGVSSSIRAQASKQSTPFSAVKRQQASQILSHASRNMAARRGFSSEIATAMVQVSQNLGMGSAAIGLGGAGIGIGMVFAALLMAVARNPSMRGQLFSYAILGFAFVEAIGLFDLMVAMMCKYV
ncbi:ATP synthase subunit, mitochondrial [Lachnellula subtilissima]|uniref:ATP synthase subunit 9, mitochondrial n=1 Tax=Lachnellula subtilissima TaxID=602034 RepID=A0A8H8RFB1_9HELO|nr:ATP synthase subunit, mitochondrial [Lachnellula subtilissima]